MTDTEEIKVTPPTYVASSSSLSVQSKNQLYPISVTEDVQKESETDICNKYNIMDEAKPRSSKQSSTNTLQSYIQSDDDSGCVLEEYTWIPPGLKPEQVI